MRQNKLSVPRLEQQQSLWCWAAVVSMVLHFFGGKRIRQCEIASHQFGYNDCQKPAHSLKDEQSSNQAVQPESIQKIYQSYKVKTEFLRKPISYRSIQNEIDSGRPVQICHFWLDFPFFGEASESGHLVLLYGWKETNHGQYVFVNDPLSYLGRGAIVYEDLVTAEEQGQWEYTWTRLDKARRG